MSKSPAPLGTIARFATRPIDGKPDQSDLFVGIMLKHQGPALRPGFVYEIQNVLDELVIVPVGPSAEPSAWNHTVNEVITSHREEVFCTTNEVARTRRTQQK